MSAMSNAQFADAVHRMFRPDEAFSPRATYIPEGDCIEFVAAPDDYYAERVDALVTVYWSRDSGEIVGSLIKGVKGICENLRARFPGFGIEIEAGSVKLRHLFQACLWSEPRSQEDMAVVSYRKLIKVAEDTDATAPLAAVGG